MSFKIAAMQLGKVPTTREEINTMVLVPSLGLRVERFVPEDELFKFLEDYESEFILNGAIIHLLIHDAFIMVEKGMIVVSVKAGNSYRKISVADFENAIQMNRRKIRLYDELYDLFCNMSDDGMVAIMKSYQYRNRVEQNPVYWMSDFDDVFFTMKPSEIMERLDSDFDYINDGVFAFNKYGMAESYSDIREYMDKNDIFYDDIIEYVVENEDDLDADGIRKILEGEE